MIELSNGHRLQWVTASGAGAFDGRGWWFERLHYWLGLMQPRLFTVVVKTLTARKRVGNLNWRKRFGGCVRLIDEKGQALNEWDWLMNPQRIAGTVNAVGLTNPGIDAWALNWLLRGFARSRRRGLNLAISILAESPAEATALARFINELLDLFAVEINLSCPNCLEGAALLQDTDLGVAIVKAFKAASTLPVLVKLSPQQDYLSIAEALRGTVEAISINSVPWAMVFPDRPSPLGSLLGLDGGVSGKVAQPILWEMARQLVEQNVAPVIGPSVWDRDDVTTLFDLGCQAVHFSAVHLRGPAGPMLPTRYARHYDALLAS